MLRILGSVFSLAGFVLATFVLVMQEYQWIELMMLMLGLSIGIMGIEEILRDHKGRGWVLLLTGLLCLYSSIQGFLFFH
ncbi:DUF3953 domain-containing protein [Rossellomorea vietnamensis]|uniref:DUF3953 domain-containing protein n=1 Tax=Rossellomorea vietnamensis TaxID=218284 RepID=A0ACD4CC47_9BACI|nr:DUF3953 domain-containing protein [Rossellomorea vietnamensis]UXH46230.1 DUF3953 domain-containing protein [Rossellomorea vietnamensis]